MSFIGLHRRAWLAVCALVAVGAQQAAAGAIPPADSPVSAEERVAALARLSTALREKYVFPDKGQEAVNALQQRARRGEYDAFKTGQALAKALSGHVNDVLHDGHFQVIYSAEKLADDQSSQAPSAAESAEYEALGRERNGGIERAERLPGNIGYLELRTFEFAGRGARAAAAALALLGETDALIVDVRRSRGGDPDMVTALCSHFFAEPTHVNDIYDRVANETRQFWTSIVPGGAYLGKDVYVLTSSFAPSAAEEFAYDLQQLKRATLIGGRTRGAANPGGLVRLSDHLSARIPTGRPINPISKTNWEGTGVIPDVVVPSEDALRVAQLKALNKALAGSKSPALKREIEDRLKALAQPSGG